MLNKCIKISLAVVLVSGLTALPAAAGTVDIITNGDTYIDGSVPDNNNGNNGVGVTSAGGYRAGLLRFDNLPADFAGATVNSATLYLARVEVWGDTVDPNSYVRAHQILDDANWVQGVEEDAAPSAPGATWNHADGSTSAPWDAAGEGTVYYGSVVDMDAIAPSTDNELDVTVIFQNWADGQFNNGIILTGSVSGGVGYTTWYASLEYSGGSYGDAPHVIVDYSGSVRPTTLILW